MPAAGIAATCPFWKRLSAYLSCLPLYFGLAVVYIKIFNPADAGTLDVRTKKLMISVVFALLQALFHRQIFPAFECGDLFDSGRLFGALQLRFPGGAIPCRLG